MNLPDIVKSGTRNQYWIFFSILVALTLFMMLCNGPSSSYSGFDFFFHYRRLYSLTEAFRLGIYPSYLDFSNAEGYGYFSNGFYPDVILIPFALIGIFTGIHFAYDFMVFTMTIFCGVFMYHAIRVIFRSCYVAMVGALLYTFAVYRLYDIYQRGAIAEAFSFTFLPIIFLGLYYIIKGDYKKWYILAIGYSLLIYTHVISSVLMFITLLIILIIYYKPLIKEPRRIAYLFLAGAVTLVIASFFIFPTLEQIQSNSFYLDARRPGGGAGYGKVGFDLLFWGFASGIAYPKETLWTGIGAVLTLILFSRFFMKKQKSEKLRSVDIGVIIGICFVIASCRIIPWGSFPLNLLGFIQYPWRLYEFSTFFFAIAGGYYLSLLFVNKKQRVIGLITVILVTLATTYIHSENFKNLYPQRTNEDLIRNEDPQSYNYYHTIGGEYFPSKLPMVGYIHERGEVAEAKNADTEIAELRRDKNTTIVKVNISNPDTITLPLLYYYGYSVTLNEKEVPYFQNDFGLIAVPANESGEIKAYYAGTTVRKASYYIAVVAVLVLIVFIVRTKRRKEK